MSGVITVAHVGHSGGKTWQHFHVRDQRPSSHREGSLRVREKETGDVSSFIVESWSAQGWRSMVDLFAVDIEHLEPAGPEDQELVLLAWRLVHA